MAYSIEMAERLTEQLERFVSSNRYQLVGQAANLGFWIKETLHCLSVLDGYDDRFHQLKESQSEYIKSHKTTSFEFFDPCCTRKDVMPPRRVDKSDFTRARIKLLGAAERMLRRCHKESFVEIKSLVKFAMSLDIDVNDLIQRTD
jgi:hypothetical protein